MRKLLFPIIVLMLFLGSTALAAGYIPITDEIDLDYDAKRVRVFVSATYKQDTPVLDKKAGAKMLEYINTLTINDERDRLVEVFEKRPTLKRKAIHAIEKYLKRDECTYSREDDFYQCYYTLELKLVKEAIPDLNYPKKD